MDGDVLGSWWYCRGVDCFEEHGAAVLIEEFGGCVNVVVGTGIGAADYHYCVAGSSRGGGVVDAVVVDRGLEDVGVSFEPVQKSLSESH